MLHIAGDVVAGFVGGTVGVLGTILALEYKMKKVSRPREGGTRGTPPRRVLGAALLS